MNIKRLAPSNCSVYKLSDAVNQGVEKLLLSAVLGRVFILNENNDLIGVFSVDHCGKGGNLNMLSQIPSVYDDNDLHEQVLNILAAENGKYYGILPVLDKNNKFVGAVTCTDNIWDSDKINCLAKLEYLSEKKLSIEEWFLDKGYRNVAFWGLDELSLAFSNEIKHYPDITVAGIYENVKLKEHKKIDYLNYETDVNFVNSIADIISLDIDLIVVTDWTLRHIQNIPMLKNKRPDVMYAPRILLESDVIRYANTSLEKEFKKSVKGLGCGFLTIRIPTNDDLGLSPKEPTMTFEYRMNWLAKQDGWQTDSKELETFNNERHFVPQNIKKTNGQIAFADYEGKYMNFINRTRVVLNTPSKYENIVYLVGPCIVSGLFNSDKNTLGYFLQEAINNSDMKYKVVALGIPNDADRYYFIRALEECDIRSGDLIFLFDQTYRQSEWDIDLLPIFEQLKKDYGSDFYYDYPVHCGKEGNRTIANFLCNCIEQHPLPKVKYREDTHTSLVETKQVRFSGNPQLKKYQEFIRSNAIHKKPGIGSIVMNCNPFTLGHKYLIEYAAAQVDYLYIFVVEEDKSFFKFEDRIELVKAGTSHLQNVKVLPSGQFIISSTTFSEYFDKANLKGTTIDTSLDVETFGSQIAPCLDISIRFVGEEPLDPITAQYNQSMKEILPKYGVELREIPRKETDGVVISASRVRKCLEEKNWEDIKKLVPETTYSFLYEKFK